LALPPSVREYVQSGQLSAGHARALLNAKDPGAIARQVIRKNLNVRQTERLVKAQNTPAPANESRSAAPENVDAGLYNAVKSLNDIPGASPAQPAAAPRKDANTIALEENLMEILG